MNDCEKWLFNFLKDRDFVLCDEVREDFKKQGFKKSEFKAARKSLRIETINNANWSEGGSTEWFWRLPK
ncbi:hypothetical protein [Heyndrickxia sporothermodurans]|uniref:hypothetical protein n=1 Tax=Heyndrickxia sporothermodurans TaxID=46224 RepID=UPI0035D77A7F